MGTENVKAVKGNKITEILKKLKEAIVSNGAAEKELPLNDDAETNFYLGSVRGNVEWVENVDLYDELETVFVRSGIGDLLPKPAAADEGKVLTASDDGFAYWATIIFEVEISNTSGTWAANKTWQECKNAYDGGAKNLRKEVTHESNFQG